MNPYAPPAAQLDATRSSASPSPLRVAFRNSFADLMLFQAYIQLRSPVFLLVLFGFGLAIALPSWLESARDINSDLGLVVTTVIVAGDPLCTSPCISKS